MKSLFPCVNILNINNSTSTYWYNKCAKLVCLAKLHPERATSYDQFEHEVSTIGLEFPITIPDGISKLEKLNPSIAINVYEWVPRYTNKTQNPHVPKK